MGYPPTGMLVISCQEAKFPPSHFYSEKEGDSSFTNRITRQKDPLPVFLFEAGNSESVACLKADAKWCLKKSEGKVLMVILIKVNKRQSTIQILKYIPIPNSTRYNFCDQPVVLSSLTAEILNDISVVPPRVQGAPLPLEFGRLFDRPSNPPAESNIVLSASRWERGQSPC